MTRLEKCISLKDKGYTYDNESGKVYGVYGKEITNKCNYGYILLPNNLKAHHFAWYMPYGNVDFEMLDHINRDKSDNRICNLRIVNNQENNFNRFGKGYYFRRNKWYSYITLNDKSIFLGSFKNEEDARQAYLKAKSIYHQLI
jgi:hypothetical protein